MPQYASNANGFARGLRSEMDEVWDQMVKETPSEVKQLFYEVGNGEGEEAANGGRYDDYYARREGGTFKRWDPDKGEKRSYNTLSDVSMRLYTMQWSNGVKWRKNDETDNRAARSLRESCQEFGEDIGLLDDRVAAVMITGSADAVTMKSSDIPLCIDGYPFFSSSHEEHANGNVRNGNGVDAASRIKSDWFGALRQWTEMKMPRNRQPFFPSGLVQRAKYVIFVSPENYEVFSEAFELKDRQQIVTNLAGNENVGASSIENILRSKYGQLVTVVPYQRISGNDWYIFMLLPNARRRPFLKHVIQEIDEKYFDEQNSVEMNDYNSRQLAWDYRARYGYLNWACGMKIDN